MKKSLSITIAGLIFNIEEDAYTELSGYLSKIKQSLAGEEAVDEIINDMEASIADKFSEKITPQKQAIGLVDVQEVVKVMGRVEEIAETDEVVEENILSEEDTDIPKRLYRNPDDAVIGGVASGIAAYFGIDPVYVRILFFILTILDGAGIFIYLILWLIIPEAKSNAQKLEMRGKPVDIAHIQAVVKEKSVKLGHEGKAAFNRLKENKSSLYKILNFPVKIVESIFIFLKRIFKVLGPTLSILFGLVFIITAFASALGLTVALGVLAFNINSPYIVSDLPLIELASQPLYYIGLVSAYVTAIIPILFIGLLATTMLKRKNTFNGLVSGVLISVWLIAIAVTTIAAGDLVPWANARWNQLETEQMVTQSFEYTDFTSLDISGNHQITITQGDEYSIELSGRETDLERLELVLEENELTINQHGRKDDTLCLFCFTRPITGEIIMPLLDSYSNDGAGDDVIKGFTEDINVNLGGATRLELELSGQDSIINMKGSSRLSLTGEAGELDMILAGSSRLDVDDLEAESISIKQNGASRVTLDGQTVDLRAEVQDAGRLDGEELVIDNAYITANDSSRVSIMPSVSLSATSTDSSYIYYVNQDDLETILHKEDIGRIEVE